MGRGHRGSRGDVEHTELQKVRHENQTLKKQIAKLRKMLSKIDIDRYSHLRDIIEANVEDHDYSVEDKERELEVLKKKWQCKSCNEDYLRMIMVPRADGIFYFRKCLSCANRTKLQKFHEGSGTNGITTDGEIV